MVKCVTATALSYVVFARRVLQGLRRGLRIMGGILSKLIGFPTLLGVPTSQASSSSSPSVIEVGDGLHVAKSRAFRASGF